jgi:tRNA pseudouridine38-40 synthase
MTGSLAEVGVGRWTAGDLKSALEARDRKACGPVAPPDGLYLTGVAYEPKPAPPREGGDPNGD